MKVEIYIRPQEEPRMFPSDANIRLYYNDQWIYFRDGKVVVTKEGETRKYGKCSACDTKVIKIINSDMPTCRTDGSRFIYADKDDGGWCIFRCKTCKSVIDATWEGEI